MKTETQVSSGGIVYRLKEKQIKVAVARLNDIFVLPKGLVDKGESVEETAIREVKEETNLRGQIETKLGVINYWFYLKAEDKRIHKFVHFFLMKHKKGEPLAQASELSEVNWVPIKEAQRKLNYKGEKEMLSKAITYLGKLSLPEKI